jgi:hypothetical protein
MGLKLIAQQETHGKNPTTGYSDGYFKEIHTILDMTVSVSK